MPVPQAEQTDADRKSEAFYVRALRALHASGVPFLVGGAYALEHYTGIVRRTKDFDVFVRPEDCRRVLDALAAAGYQTELTYPHWLGKAFADEHYVDVIFSSGNGVARVDDIWFQHAVPAEILGTPVKLCPPEETIWSKAFVMERERFDGADVNHVLRSCAPRMDWQRLLARFGAHWRVLLAHLLLFGYVYPAERGKVPAGVLRDLLERLENETCDDTPLPAAVCQGTLLSREQYLSDVERWGYQDARFEPHGTMNRADATAWMAAIGATEPSDPPAPPRPRTTPARRTDPARRARKETDAPERPQRRNSATPGKRRT